MRITKAWLRGAEEALVESIEEKWKPLSSGAFSDYEPPCACCKFQDDWEAKTEHLFLGACKCCPLEVLGFADQASTCMKQYKKWDSLRRWGNYNSPEAVKAAKKVLAALRKALRMVRAKLAKYKGKRCK